MVENAPIKRGPGTGWETGRFEGGIGPGVAGLEKAVRSFGFVEGIAFAINHVGRYQDRFSFGVGRDASENVGNQLLVLLMIEVDFYTEVVFLNLSVIGCMQSR